MFGRGMNCVVVAPWRLCGFALNSLPQKAVLKTRAVQTLRACRAFTKFAERLDCGARPERRHAKADDMDGELRALFAQHLAQRARRAVDLRAFFDFHGNGFEVTADRPDVHGHAAKVSQDQAGMFSVKISSK